MNNMHIDAKPGLKVFFMRFSGQFSAAFSRLGFVCAIAAIAGFAGRFHWLIDLLNHFRIHYAAMMMISALLLLLNRKYQAFLAMTVLFSLNFIVIFPYFFSDVPTENYADGKIRAMLINVNSRQGSPSKVLNEIRTVSPDILVLEEITALWLERLKALEEIYQYRISEPREDNFGIALYSRIPMTDPEIIPAEGSGVPIIRAYLLNNGNPFRIVAAHPLPPIGRRYAHLRDLQLESMPELLIASCPSVLIGDLNATPWSCHFVDLISSANLYDSMKGRGVQNSWPSRILWAGIPIDHFLYTEGIKIIAREIGRDVDSDHRPLIVDFLIK